MNTKNKSRLLREEDIIKIVDKHTSDDNRLDDDISCILEEIPDASSNINWISVEDRLPTVGETKYTSQFDSVPVLVQTRKGEMFVAIRSLVVFKKYKDEDNWYSYGTGGRRMKVMSKVIAWMPLPEPYVGEN